MNFDSLPKKLYLGFHNCILSVHRNYLKNNSFLDSIIFFLTFLVHCVKFFWPLLGKNCLVAQSACYVSLGSFWGKNFFRKFFHLFRMLSDMSRLSVERFAAGLLQLHSTSLLEQLEENWIFRGNYLFLSFSDSDQKFLGFLSTCFRRACQFSFQRDQRNILMGITYTEKK